MAEMTTFEVLAREAAGKGPAGRLRRAGRVPAVIYGDEKAQQFVSLETRLLRRELTNPRFFSTLYGLRLDGETIRVLPYDVQRHPVSDDPIHADFKRVARGATIEVAVPVRFVNDDVSRGLKRGGVLNVVRREVELLCPADAIPGELVVDLAPFDIGDSVHISHVGLPAGVRPTITDRDFTIATISATTAARDEALEEAAEAEEAAAAEVEGVPPAGSGEGA
jgi:large subunit ribosomal protein L25